MPIRRVDYNTLTRNVGEIPSMKIFESDKTLAFLDIGPLSKGHSVRPF
jgi:diadenosine tetraphosphate (Ap4A) HIT family hydrolase